MSYYDKTNDLVVDGRLATATEQNTRLANIETAFTDVDIDVVGLKDGSLIGNNVLDKDHLNTSNVPVGTYPALIADAATGTLSWYPIEGILANDTYQVKLVDSR